MQEDEHDLELVTIASDKLVEALLSAFPSQMDLYIMLFRYKLEENFICYCWRTKSQPDRL